MFRYSEKLLVIFLALLLGLSPLQGALAGVVNSFEQKENAHQMSDTHCAASMDVGNVSHDGTQCSTQNDCHEQDCSTGHCASCVMAVLPEVSRISRSGDASDFPSFQSQFINSGFTSPYRPPRA